ncbi:MAG: hypothetical protein AAAFM81_10790 [Pseudomonadota bacterium]
MNRKDYAIGLAAAIVLAPTVLADSRVERVFTETFEVGSNPELTIKNIWGNITVLRGKPGRISVEVSEDRSAADREAFDLSLEMIPLRIEQQGDAVSLIVGRRRENQDQHWHCDECRAQYQFVATVPANTTLNLKAINDGDVTVSDIDGVVSARNVNGSVFVEGLRDCDSLKSVNGEINASLNASLPSDCNVETVNGDITFGVSPKSDFRLALTQMNGRVYSEIDVDELDVEPAIETKKRGGRLHYKIRQPAGLRVGNGNGATFHVESLNGDVSIVEVE